MNKLLVIALAMFFTVTAHAVDMTQQTLEGDWLVVEFQGKPDNDNTLWQFKGNSFVQNLNGQKLFPDPYKASQGLIDLGYGKIIVNSFDGQVMEATMAGFKYKLIKQ